MGCEHRVGQSLRSNASSPLAFRSLRVYLGDTAFQQTVVGAARRVSVRERNARTQEVDVLIDAHAPLLFGVLHWCKRAAATTQVQLQMISHQKQILTLLLQVQAVTSQ